MKKLIEQYLDQLTKAFDSDVSDEIEKLGEALNKVWESGNTLYICGNGGSAGNAISSILNAGN